MRSPANIELPVQVERLSRVPLAVQIYEQIRQLILDGQLSPGGLLPSSRPLSRKIGVSRAMVLIAYDQLKAEGYIEAKSGSATRVAMNIALAPVQPEQPLHALPIAASASLSQFAQRLREEKLFYPAATSPAINFHSWSTATDINPIRYFSRYLAKLGRGNNRELLGYLTDQMGYKPLREAIVKSVYRSHGIKTRANQILIVCGLPQAYSLIARIHLERGDFVAVENPGYPPAHKTFQIEGAAAVPVAVDEQGLVVDELLAQVDKRFRLVYITPTHQFPTGSSLSLSRRLELLSWARITGALIIEDEHDCAFQYDSSKTPALKALDQHESVIFIGTYAKQLFPSLALAYLILPERLVAIYTRASELVSDSVPTIVQAALADFIVAGGLSRHIKRMTGVYQLRRNALVSSLEQHFGDRVKIFGQHSGLHLLVRFETNKDDDEIIEEACSRGVGLLSTRNYYLHGAAPHEYLLGFGDLDPGAIEEGISRLADIILGDRPDDLSRI